MISVLENVYPGVLCNIIVDIFDVVLKYLPVLIPYDISQLKQKLFIKVGATFRSTDGVTIHVAPAYLGPSP